MSSLLAKRNMQLIRRLETASTEPTAVAIGNFDGLHQGHAQVIATMLRDARGLGLIPSVLTFEPHPRRYFAPNAPLFRLESLSQKLHRLRAWGVERVYMPRFNAAFASQSAEEFLETVLQRQLQAKVVVTGENFAFGKGRGGNTALLRDWGATHGVTIHTLPAVMQGDTVCSSSAVREALSRGDVAQAAALLGHPYSISGWVQHGDKRGRQLGFPTANVALPMGLKLPAYGVYAVCVSIHALRHPGAGRDPCEKNMHVDTGLRRDDGTQFPAVANLGIRPSIDAHLKPSLEVHIFDFDTDIYGAKVTVEFVAHIRHEQKFDNLAALKAQIATDCASARKIV